MERSEIIKHISEDLEDKLEMLKRGKFDYVAEEILDMLEGFEMLPPFNAKLFGKINAIEGLDYHSWEPEVIDNE